MGRSVSMALLLVLHVIGDSRRSWEELAPESVPSQLSKRGRSEVLMHIRHGVEETLLSGGRVRMGEVAGN